MHWISIFLLVAISKHARAEVSYPLDFVGVVYHGLPMDQYTPVGKKQRDRFVWIGRCDPEKGPHLAIQAAKEAGGTPGARRDSRSSSPPVGPLLPTAD
jgi:hypothetical protein